MGRTSPLKITPTESGDCVFDESEFTPEPDTPDVVTPQSFEETPFSPPASIAQHFQSLKPRLVSLSVPPPTTRKQAKPQKIPQQQQQLQHADDDCETFSERRKQQQSQQQKQQRQHRGEPAMPVPPLQGQPPGQQAPQGYICINVPIYIGNGQPGSAQVPPLPPQVSYEYFTLYFIFVCVLMPVKGMITFTFTIVSYDVFHCSL